MRYTIKNGEGLLVESSSEYLLSNDVWLGACVQKLGEVEDILQTHKIKTLEELDGLLEYAKKFKNIEEEIGINLITFLEIILGKRTFFEKGIDGTIIENIFDDDEIHDLCEEYGETWALTKEELL